MDVFQVFDDTNIGEFAFFFFFFLQKNGSRVVEYVLPSQDDIFCLKNFQILEQNAFSDHVSILLSFPRKFDRHPNGNTSNKNSRKLKIVYEESKREKFKSLILNCVEKIQTLTDDLNNEPVQDQSLMDETETIFISELDSETNTESLNAIMHQKNNTSPGIDNLIVENLLWYYLTIFT